MKLTFFFLYILCFFLPDLIEEDTTAQRGLASSWNVIPSRSLTGLHYIFKGYLIDENEDLVKVSGPVVQITNVNKNEVKVHKEGYSASIELETFEQEQDLGQSVFEATTGQGGSVGTAFLVGRDVVFTNRHVIIPTIDKADKEWPCGNFSIKLNHRDEKVSCKEVKFCSATHDFCVVELNKMSNERAVGSEVRILRLTKNVRPIREEQLFHIGNIAGLGLQASKGRGLELSRQSRGEFKHYVPTLGGSSGAPIFDDRGDVIGINYGHNGKNYTDSEAYNVGVFSTTIYNSLLYKHPKVLKQIKSFRKWRRKSKAPVALRFRKF